MREGRRSEAKMRSALAFRSVAERVAVFAGDTALNVLTALEVPFRKHTWEEEVCEAVVASVGEAGEPLCCSALRARHVGVGPDPSRCARRLSMLRTGASIIAAARVPAPRCFSFERLAASAPSHQALFCTFPEPWLQARFVGAWSPSDVEEAVFSTGSAAHEQLSAMLANARAVPTCSLLALLEVCASRGDGVRTAVVAKRLVELRLPELQKNEGGKAASRVRSLLAVVAERGHVGAMDALWESGLPWLDAAALRAAARAALRAGCERSRRHICSVLALGCEHPESVERACTPEDFVVGGVAPPGVAVEVLPSEVVVSHAIKHRRWYLLDGILGGSLCESGRCSARWLSPSLGLLAGSGRAGLFEAALRAGCELSAEVAWAAASSAACDDRTFRTAVMGTKLRFGTGSLKTAQIAREATRRGMRDVLLHVASEAVEGSAYFAVPQIVADALRRASMRARFGVEGAVEAAEEVVAVCCDGAAASLSLFRCHSPFEHAVFEAARSECTWKHFKRRFIRCDISFRWRVRALALAARAGDVRAMRRIADGWAEAARSRAVLLEAIRGNSVAALDEIERMCAAAGAPLCIRLEYTPFAASVGAADAYRWMDSRDGCWCRSDKTLVKMAVRGGIPQVAEEALHGLPGSLPSAKKLRHKLFLGLARGGHFEALCALGPANRDRYLTFSAPCDAALAQAMRKPALESFRSAQAAKRAWDALDWRPTDGSCPWERKLPAYLAPARMRFL